MCLRTKYLVIVFLSILFYTIIAPIVHANPEASLWVSLPYGSYVGSDPDPWITESWVQEISGNTWSFTVRVEETHSQSASYDTHLVVALNDAGLAKLVSITIGSETKGPSDFTDGTPTYYMYTMSPHGVYPTPYYDGYIIGTLDNDHIDIQITATFKDTVGVMMHFDAYGTASGPPPQNMGDVTHNPFSHDSTVRPPPPQVPEFNVSAFVAASFGAMLLLSAQKLRKGKFK